MGLFLGKDATTRAGIGKDNNRLQITSFIWSKMNRASTKSGHEVGRKAKRTLVPKFCHEAVSYGWYASCKGRQTLPIT